MDIISIIMSLASQVYAISNLIVVIAFCAGLLCLYKVIEILVNRQDEQRNPLTAIPFYFIGAAIGIGFGLSSDLAQKTIFNSAESHENEVVFKTLNENNPEPGGNIPNQ